MKAPGPYLLYHSTSYFDSIVFLLMYLELFLYPLFYSPVEIPDPFSTLKPSLFVRLITTSSFLRGSEWSRVDFIMGLNS